MISVGMKEIVQRIVDQKKVGVTKKLAAEIVDEFYDAVAYLLQNVDSVKLGKLGTFKVATKKAHIGRNPRTGEAVNVPDKMVLRFYPSKTIKEMIQEEE